MFLSFIIPMYNREGLIRRCLDSILSQNADDVEIICVDDASTDGTRDVVKEYQNKYANIIMLVNEKNRGQSFARNRGMEYAQGEYIWFVDSDDYIVNNALEGLRKYSEEKKTDIVYFDSLRISDAGETYGRLGG